MKFLVIGLGSMGKRRIRCLKALNINNVVGFDPRADRATEAAEKYGVKTHTDFDRLDLTSFDALIISTPPDLHETYIEKAIALRKPAFVEASVVLKDLESLSQKAKAADVFIAPSTTLRFHPVIKAIRELVKSRRHGKVTNFHYVSGQYLPDWHPWEKINDYYVSKKSTGGAREIVPFELTWMTEVFGWPEKVQCFFGKTLEMGADIDDTYALNLRYDGFIGQLLVDVVARFAQRRLLINMETAQLTWDWNERDFKIYDSKTGETVTHKQPDVLAAAAGYNPNITEQMYVEELSSFIRNINEPANYPNSLDNDIRILKLLLTAEASGS